MLPVFLLTVSFNKLAFSINCIPVKKMLQRFRPQYLLPGHRPSRTPGVYVYIYIAPSFSKKPQTVFIDRSEKLSPAPISICYQSILFCSGLKNKKSGTSEYGISISIAHGVSDLGSYSYFSEFCNIIPEFCNSSSYLFVCIIVIVYRRLARQTSNAYISKFCFSPNLRTF